MKNDVNKKKKIVQTCCLIAGAIILVSMGLYILLITITRENNHGYAQGGFSSEMTAKAPRTDEGEIKVSDVIKDGNAASQMNPLTGETDKIAEEKRKAILEAKDTVVSKESGTVYYISPNGSSTNTGTSEDSPNTFAELDYLNLQEGDTVLFERGGIYRLKGTPIKAKKGVTYGAYGEGDKPCIYGSPKNYADMSVWKPSKKENVWKISITYGDVGSIVFDHGKEVGIKKGAGLNQLQKNGDYFHNEDNDYLYLYCDKGNPGRAYQDIEFCIKGSIFFLDSLVSDVTIDNLCLKYIGEFAVNAQYGNNNITITNCEMGYIGGTKLSLALRYGNAIQFWHECQNVTVENNWIYQVYDTAITFQGSSETTPKYANISFSDNLLEYNDMDIEVWHKSEGYSIEGLKMNNNIMRFNSYGWGTRDEDSGNRGGASPFKINFMSVGNADNIEIKNNIIDRPRFYVVSFSGSEKSVEFNGNTVYAFSDRETTRPIVVIQRDANSESIEFAATNQSTLENAFKAVDSSAKEIKWTDVTK